MIDWILVLIALVLANLPWFSDKLFFIIPLKRPTKSFFWCLFEWLVLYFVMGGLARYAEVSQIGQAATQKWEFYAVTVCLFIVLSFPGFVARYLWTPKRSS